MKKILIISFEYPIGKSYCGGVGQVVKQNRNALLEMGYQVYLLISANFATKYPVKLLLPNDSLMRYPTLRAFLRDYNWCAFNYIIHHFVNWTKEMKNLKSEKGIKPRIIYHFHSILRRERDAGFRTLHNYLYDQEKMIDLSDKIICPSAYEYDNFVRYYPSFSDKVVVIENTIERFPADKGRMEEIKKRHNIKEKDIVSIWVGRVERLKGAHILINVVPQILKKYRHLKLFFIGKSVESDLYKKLQRLLKRFPTQLFYKNYLKKEELFQYFYLSNIYINSSLTESFSLSTHESALCNNALLLNRLPVLEKFRDAAVFFDPRTPKARRSDTSLGRPTANGDFTRQYKGLIENSALRNRLSKKAALIAINHFKHNRLKQDLAQLFSCYAASKN